MRLMREIRFSLDRAAAERPVVNAWAGWPLSDAVAPYLILRAWVNGAVDARTGYLCNIAFIDRVLRERAIPRLRQTWLDAGGRPVHGAGAVEDLWASLEARWPAGLAPDALELRLNPYLSFTAHRGELPMIVMTESFEFAASHRLYCRDDSDDRNRETFGKCANPNGHGHNYVVEVSVAGEPDSESGTIMDHAAFERTVRERVIDRFDHQHLNQDCAEFADLNPTVENITRVIWTLLVDSFAPARLHAVRVWETPKTCAEFRGQ